MRTLGKPKEIRFRILTVEEPKSMFGIPLNRSQKVYGKGKIIIATDNESFLRRIQAAIENDKIYVHDDYEGA